MFTRFQKSRPNAKIEKRRNNEGDYIIYINGKAAFNMSSKNTSNWEFAMESAYQRSLKK